MKRYYQREYVVYFNKEALFLFHAFVNITKTLKVHTFMNVPVHVFVLQRHLNTLHLIFFKENSLV